MSLMRPLYGSPLALREDEARVRLAICQEQKKFLWRQDSPTK
jgi:hypothetical protein